MFHYKHARGCSQQKNVDSHRQGEIGDPAPHWLFDIHGFTLAFFYFLSRLVQLQGKLHEISIGPILMHI